MLIRRVPPKSVAYSSLAVQNVETSAHAHPVGRHISRRSPLSMIQSFRNVRIAEKIHSLGLRNRNSLHGVGPQKPRARLWTGLSRLGGDVQPPAVTVLTPATSTLLRKVLV